MANPGCGCSKMIASFPRHMTLSIHVVHIKGNVPGSTMILMIEVSMLELKSLRLHNDDLKFPPIYQTTEKPGLNGTKDFLVCLV